MFSKLSFGQKLALWFGCAMLVIACSSIAIYFQLAKNGPPKDVERFINKELMYSRSYEETDWNKEEQKATGQISVHSKSAYWYSKRGDARWQLENYKGALSDYDSAVRLDPKDYASLACRASMREILGDSVHALEDANKAILLKPNVGWLYATRGHIYANRRDYNAALEDLDKCLKHTDEKRRYHAEKAGVYVQIRRFDKAISELEAGTKAPKTRKSDDSFHKLVDLYISVGNIEQAQNACENWIEDPNPTEDAFQYSANVCRALDEKEKEYDAYRKYLEYLQDKLGTDPTNSELYYQRAVTYEKLGDKEKARSNYQEVLDEYLRKRDKRKYSPEDIIRFGELYQLIGRKDEMLKLYKAEIAKYDRKIKQSPKDGPLFLHRAELFAKLGDDVAALNDFETAKKLQDSSSIASAWARYSLKKRNYKQSLKLRQEFLGSHNPRSYSALAEVFEVMGDHSKAIDMANTALTLDRTLPDAYYWLGKARAGKGDFAESKRKLQQATAFGYDPSAIGEPF